MHCHALAAGYVPNNGLASNRVTTSGPIDEQVAVAFDADGIAMIPTKNPAHHTANAGILLCRLSRLFRRRGQLAEELTRGILSVADPRHQIVRPTKPIIRSYALKLIFLDVLQRDAILAGFF